MAEKRPQFPTLPVLVGEKVYLRAASAEDIANTHHWYMQSDPHMLTPTPFMFQTAAEAADAYRKLEKSDLRQMFVIARQADNMPVGLIGYQNTNLLNRATELTIIVDPEVRKNGYALEALRLLTKYLARYREINRMTMQVSTMNLAAAKMLEKAGFKREGVLRKLYFYQREFRDGALYSLLGYELD